LKPVAFVETSYLNTWRLSLDFDLGRSVTHSRSIAVEVIASRASINSRFRLHARKFKGCGSCFLSDDLLFCWARLRNIWKKSPLTSKQLHSRSLCTWPCPSCRAPGRRSCWAESGFEPRSSVPATSVWSWTSKRPARDLTLNTSLAVAKGAANDTETKKIESGT